MKLSGKIIKIEDNKFTGKDGEEKHVKTVILQEVTNGDFKDEAVFEFFGEKADKFEFTEGQFVTVWFGFKVDKREHDGKTYYSQKLNAFRAQII